MKTLPAIREELRALGAKIDAPGGDADGNETMRRRALRRLNVEKHREYQRALEDADDDPEPEREAPQPIRRRSLYN